MLTIKVRGKWGVIMQQVQADPCSCRRILITLKDAIPLCLFAFPPKSVREGIKTFPWIHAYFDLGLFRTT
jgi:hypothetical protein